MTTCLTHNPGGVPCQKQKGHNGGHDPESYGPVADDSTTPAAAQRGTCEQCGEVVTVDVPPNGHTRAGHDCGGDEKACAIRCPVPTLCGPVEFPTQPLPSNVAEPAAPTPERHVYDPIDSVSDQCECGQLEDSPIHFTDEEYEERQRPRIVNAPGRIWLQTGCDNEVGEIEFAELSTEDVTWCAEQIDNTDIEYVRADLAAATSSTDESNIRTPTPV